MGPSVVLNGYESKDRFQAKTLIGNKTLLVRLILYPEDLPNWEMVSRHSGIEVSGSDINISKSSAYNDTLWTRPHLVILRILLLHYNAATSGSMTRSKRRGDNGQPCRVPLWTVKYCELKLLVLTLAWGAAYNIWIQETKTGPEPNLLRVLKRCSYSIRSKAFRV